MTGVRRGARAALRYYVPLLFLLVIVQIFLAGEGVFGIRKGPQLDDQKALDPHRVLGLLGWFSGQLWRRAGTTEMAEPAPAVT